MKYITDTIRENATKFFPKGTVFNNDELCHMDLDPCKGIDKTIVDPYIMVKGETLVALGRIENDLTYYCTIYDLKRGWAKIV